MMTALAACFRQTVVYQPSRLTIPSEMEKWAASNLLDIRIPVAGHENRLEVLLKDYADWTNLHQAGAVKYLKARHGSTPFFDETSASQIRAEIKAQSRPSQSQEHAEYLLNAALFLHIAQDYDLQNNTLKQDLLSFEAMEQHLFDNLKGENETAPLPTTAKDSLSIDDPGLYMPLERLKSWALLEQHDQEASGLYITTSRSILDELMERAPELVKVFHFDAVPVDANREDGMARWQDGLIETLSLLLTNPWPPSPDLRFEAPAAKRYNKTVALQLYLAAGETPHQFFARSVPGARLDVQKEQKETVIKNTVIGVIEF